MASRIVEETVEEEIAVVQFSGLVDANLLKEKAASCKFFKLNEEEPILQMGNQLFQGSLDYQMGTALIFEEATLDKTTSRSANVTKDSKKLSFFAKTDKVLPVKRVFLHPKESDNEKDQSS